MRQSKISARPIFRAKYQARLAPVVAIAVAVAVVVAAVAVVAAAVAVVAAVVAVVAAVLRKVRASFTLANFFANTNASIFFARNREFKRFASRKLQHKGQEKAPGSPLEFNLGR